MRVQAAIVRRSRARMAVRIARLPMLRPIVDRARQLLDENSDLKRGALDVTVDALLIEFRRAA